MVLTLTPAAMQNIIKICRIHSPSEACGFVVADKERPTVGHRVVWMQNVAERPLHTFRMDDDAVRQFYGDCDSAGEDPVAVFHCHPTTEPVMSADDLRGAQDDSLAYLVVSLAGPVVKARAYTVERFIGNTEATEISIRVLSQSISDLQTLPVGPWALAPDNQVRILYQRTNKKPLSTNVARVLGCDGDVVRLDPVYKTAARQIPLERIRSIHVIKESALGQAMREQLRLYATEARILLAGHEVEAVPSLLDALHQAFPLGIAITMEPPA